MVGIWNLEEWFYINRNTRTTKGNFVIREITEDSKGYSDSKDKNIRENGKIIESFNETNT